MKTIAQAARWSGRCAVAAGLLAMSLSAAGSAQTGAAESMKEESAMMEISAAFPFESKFATVFGSKMHYVEAGSGDPVLFIHGQPTSSYLWRNIIPYVRTSHRAIAVDLIGMGKSDKPDIPYRYADHSRYLDEFVRVLGLQNVTVVGHDWGSVLGLDYAMRHEGNVKGLAFMEALIPPAFPLPSLEALPAPAREMFRGFRDPEQGRKLLIDQNVFIEQMLPGMVMRKLSEAEMDAYREPFGDPATRLPLYRWPNELPIGGKPEATFKVVSEVGAWLQQTGLPKLHLYASPGAANPAEVVAWTAQHLRNIETAFVGSGVHFIQEDQPDAIGRALADWLRRLAAAGDHANNQPAMERSGTMPGYVIAKFEVDDKEAYGKYKELAGPTMAAFGGKLLGRTGAPVNLEGDQPGFPNWVIIEFPSVDAAREWYGSREYQEAKAARMGAGDMVITIVEGS